MTEEKTIQLQTFKSPPGLKKIQPQRKWMRWGINRLESFPFLYSTGDSVVSSSCTVEGHVLDVTEVHVTSFPIKEGWFPEESDKLSPEKYTKYIAKWRYSKKLERITFSYPEDEQWAMLSKYDNLSRNEHLLRDHVVQKEVDIAVCDCDLKRECRFECLNALLSIECTPNYCPCGALCQNLKFQKCDYARVRKEQTNDRGWGLFADQDIKESGFVIEYCGEVMSDTVGQSRLRAYAAAGLKETYMMYLDGTEILDATRKGNLARFINHSCEPNCRLRKWTVLGELRIGIFALRDIKSGEELTYDYRIQCHGDTKIKCLCGSSSCVGFLGIKLRASQETLEFEDILMQEPVASEDISMKEAVEFEDNESKGNAGNVGVDIFTTSNQGDLSNQELLSRLYLAAVGVCNVRGLSAQLTRQEISAPVGAPVAKRRRVAVMKELDRIDGSMEKT